MMEAHAGWVVLEEGSKALPGPRPGKGGARRSVLPGQLRVSSRRWRHAGAPPLRKVYLT